MLQYEADIKNTIFASGSTVSKEGSYKLMVVNSSGLTILNFVIDKTPPIVKLDFSKRNDNNNLYLDIDATATIEIIPCDVSYVIAWDGATAGDKGFTPHKQLKG